MQDKPNNSNKRPSIDSKTILELFNKEIIKIGKVAQNLGMKNHTMRVICILDCSKSMYSYPNKYFKRDGDNKLAPLDIMLLKALAIASYFRNDKEESKAENVGLDIVKLGNKETHLLKGQITLGNFDTYIASRVKEEQKKGNFFTNTTIFDSAILCARKHLFENPRASKQYCGPSEPKEKRYSEELIKNLKSTDGRVEKLHQSKHPTFAMVITDGDCPKDNLKRTLNQFICSSQETVFWFLAALRGSASARIINEQDIDKYNKKELYVLKDDICVSEEVDYDILKKINRLKVSRKPEDRTLDNTDISIRCANHMGGKMLSHKHFSPNRFLRKYPGWLREILELGMITTMDVDLNKLPKKEQFRTVFDPDNPNDNRPPLYRENLPPPPSYKSSMKENKGNDALSLPYSPTLSYSNSTSPEESPSAPPLSPKEVLRLAGHNRRKSMPEGQIMQSFKYYPPTNPNIEHSARQQRDSVHRDSIYDLQEQLLPQGQYYQHIGTSDDPNPEQFQLEGMQSVFKRQASINYPKEGAKEKSKWCCSIL